MKSKPFIIEDESIHKILLNKFSLNSDFVIFSFKLLGLLEELGKNDISIVHTDE